MGKKYEFTGETKIHDGVTVRRIRLIRSLKGGHHIMGSLGGWVEHEGNLSHEGKCWISGGDSIVYGDAAIRDNAVIWNSAVVRGSAVVCGLSTIYSSSIVEGQAYIEDSVVGDDAIVGGCSKVLSPYYVVDLGNKTKHPRRARVCGNANVMSGILDEPVVPDFPFSAATIAQLYFGERPNPFREPTSSGLSVITQALDMLYRKPGVWDANIPDLIYQVSDPSIGAKLRQYAGSRGAWLLLGMYPNRRDVDRGDLVDMLKRSSRSW